MNSKISRRFSTAVMLLAVAALCSACKKDVTLPGPEKEVQSKISQAELQETSRPFSTEILLNGQRRAGIGFVGKIVIRAKAKNNTKYSFEKPVAVSFIVKDKNGPVVDSFGSPLGSFLRTMESNSSQWKPGETVVLTGEEDVAGKTDGLIQYLTKTLKLPMNETVKFDKFIATEYVF